MERKVQLTEGLEDNRMRDEYGRKNNRLQAMRSLNPIDMANLLSDIAENPNKYPKTAQEWLDWFDKESGDNIFNL